MSQKPRKKSKQSNSNPNVVRRKPSIPQGANVSSLKLLAERLTQQQNSHTGTGKTSMFSPGLPIVPVPGVSTADGPRVFGFEPGYNIDNLPRSTESYSFDTLRSFAAAYDGFQLCEQRWNEIIDGLDPNVTLDPDSKSEDEDDSKYKTEIAEIKAFFEYPDKEQDIKQWMKAAIRDRLELDAVAIYPHLAMDGSLYALELMDGASIKPLVNDRGMRPIPPDPAYAQYLYGIPVQWLTSDELFYLKETPRTESVYGVPRVQRVIMRAEQALRKQTSDLATFTDGNVPPGMIELPADGTNWTVTDIEDYEKMWNSLFAGNDKTRKRLRVSMPGTKYTSFVQPEVKTDFDRFLLNICCAACGLTMDELSFTDTSNRSVGDSQEAVIYRRAIKPVAMAFARFFTMIIKRYFNPLFIFQWKGYEEADDIASQATAYGILQDHGVISPTTVAKLMHLPPQEQEVPPYIIVQGQGVVLMSDIADEEMHAAQREAKMVGLQTATENLKNPPPPEPTPPTPTNRRAPAVDPNNPNATMQEYVTWRPDDVDARLANYSKQGVEYLKWFSYPSCCDLCFVNNGATRRLGDTFPNGAILPQCHPNCNCTVNPVPHPDHTPTPSK